MRSFLASFILPIAVLGAMASAQATRPALEMLDQQVQQLYKDVHESIVRVIVPLQIVQPNQPLSNRLNPSNQLVPQPAEQPRPGESMRVSVERALNGTTQPLEVTRGTSAPTAIPISPPTRVVLAEFIGLVLDGQGNVLLPLFVDKNLVGEAQLRVYYGDNQFTTAKLLGADPQTNLAVVKLAQPVGKPIQFSPDIPPMGSLVLLLSPIRRQARLAMWTGGHDEHGVVINSAGKLSGFIRFGHMLEPNTFEPVVKQLIETGTVKRAVLGVIIREVTLEDPTRILYPDTLGSKPAARVEGIEANSAADKAGLQKGDLILSLGVNPVNDLAHFAAAIATQTGKTELHILRDGQQQTLTVDLQVR